MLCGVKNNSCFKFVWVSSERLCFDRSRRVTGQPNIMSFFFLYSGTSKLIMSINLFLRSDSPPIKDGCSVFYF